MYTSLQMDRGPKHSRGRGQGRGRAKFAPNTESDQHFSEKVGSTATSVVAFSSDSNFSSSQPQKTGRGRWSQGRGRGKIKSFTTHVRHNAAGKFCNNYNVHN